MNEKDDLSNLAIFACKSSQVLAKSICSNLEIELGKIDIKTFSDGEIRPQYLENIRGKDVFLIQNTGPLKDDYKTLVFMINAARSASAKSITAFMPYSGYSRQERKDRPRVPLSATVIARGIVNEKPNHLVFCDLHSPAITGFYDLPSDHIYARPTFLAAIKEKFEQELINKKFLIVACDVGAAKMCESYAERLDCGLVVIYKKRSNDNEVGSMKVIGDVAGYTCLIIDDIVDTAGTLAKGSVVLKENGATDVFAMITHGLLSGQAARLINQSPIKKLWVSDTLYEQGQLYLKRKKIKVISLAPQFAEVIRCIYTGKSLSKMFE